MMSPFSDAAFTRCGAQPVSRLVRRIVAKDAGPRGFTGLRTYLIGHGEVAVIDPDPPSAPLLEAILESCRGERIAHVILTHSHGRPSPLAEELAALTGAQVLSAETGLKDGQRIGARGFILEAMATPGHTADHFAFALKSENALFCGDLVSGWSPGVVMPPGGDLAAHLASLEAVRRRGFGVIWPSHGPAVDTTAPFLSDCLNHAHSRDRRILDVLASLGPSTAWELAGRLSPRIHGLVQPAAAHAILAHLARLSAQGLLACDGQPSLYARFRPAPARAKAA
jgi:glyoxylase-like metal-dependent hydrolase (beta-lactamase superfamily II)